MIAETLIVTAGASYLGTLIFARWVLRRDDAMKARTAMTPEVIERRREILRKQLHIQTSIFNDNLGRVREDAHDCVLEILRELRALDKADLAAAASPSPSP